MPSPNLSIIIPARNEQFLAPTIADVLAQAKGSIEVLVMLDGGGLVAPVPDDPRVTVVPIVPKVGMRDAVNQAVALARGRFIFKLDAHCRLSEGFDEILTRSCEPDWVVIPRRYFLDGDTWERRQKTPIDAHYLAYPWERPDDPECGIHGTPWGQRGKDRRDVLIDDEMCTQGSAWLCRRDYFIRQLGPLSRALYSPNVMESTEWGLKCWLSGGRMVVNKHAWYAHLQKGQRWRRGYVTSGQEQRRGSQFAAWFWMTDQPFPNRVQTIRWIVEKFWPVPSWPTTPSGELDWDTVARTTLRLARNPHKTVAAVA